MPNMPATTSIKRVGGTGSDDGSSTSSDGSSSQDEKTIPFLRRLRDMLKENEDVICFIAGRREDEDSHNGAGKKVLGRIVVRDRIEVERRVLPKYFNHSSFASLRRQLNYFSFVRLGKGRQRESTYLNEGVVELDDILHLKRRTTAAAAGGAGGSSSPSSSSLPASSPAGSLSAEELIKKYGGDFSNDSSSAHHQQLQSLVGGHGNSGCLPQSSILGTATISAGKTKKRKEKASVSSKKVTAPDGLKKKTISKNTKKRRRLNNHAASATKAACAITGFRLSPFVISEDEQDHHSSGGGSSRNGGGKRGNGQQLSPPQHISLDLTTAEPPADADDAPSSATPDAEILAGCSALLGLSNLAWVA